MRMANLSDHLVENLYQSNMILFYYLSAYMNHNYRIEWNIKLAPDTISLDRFLEIFEAHA